MYLNRLGVANDMIIALSNIYPLIDKLVSMNKNGDHTD